MTQKTRVKKEISSDLIGHLLLGALAIALLTLLIWINVDSEYDGKPIRWLATALQIPATMAMGHYFLPLFFGSREAIRWRERTLSSLFLIMTAPDYPSAMDRIGTSYMNLVRDVPLREIRGFLKKEDNVMKELFNGPANKVTKQRVLRQATAIFGQVSGGKKVLTIGKG